MNITTATFFCGACNLLEKTIQLVVTLECAECCAGRITGCYVTAFSGAQYFIHMFIGFITLKNTYLCMG